MYNLYTMTATVDELRRVFGSFEGERDNLPPFKEIYSAKPAPVLRRDDDGLKLETMTWASPALRPQRVGPLLTCATWPSRSGDRR